MKSGNLKSAPIAARCDFGEKGSHPALPIISPEMPSASAVRAMAPRLAGSAVFSSIMYRPLLMKESIICGVFDEDLFQEQCIVLSRCIMLFRS